MTITISDPVTPNLGRLREHLTPEKLNARIAPAVQRLIVDHLAVKEGEGNKNGWPSQHFYANAARSASWTATAAAAIVSINHVGFRLRVEGGTVKPVESKYLTIPARSEAYGRRAREFGNLVVLWGRNGPYALAAKEGGATLKVFRGREASGSDRTVPGAEQGVILYWLVKQSVQQADPTVLPSRDEISAVATETVEDYVAQLKRRNN